MAYIKIDYSDDRVCGRYQTGPIVLVPTEKGERDLPHFYEIYEQTDTKLERPVIPELKRTGEYEIVTHLFSQDKRVDLDTEQSIVDYDHPGVLGISADTGTKNFTPGTSRYQWYKTNRRIYFQYREQDQPLKIECDLINTSPVSLDCQMFIEIHYRS